MGFFSLFNPFGPAAPPVMGAQMLGCLIFGVAGGVVGAFPGLWTVRRRSILVVAALGGVLTSIYDLLTTLAGAFTYGFSESLLAYVGAATVFWALHIVTNVVIFGVMGGEVLPSLVRRERGGG
jgi:hypothetical protein